MKLFYGLLLLGAYLCTTCASKLPKDFGRCKYEDSACIVKRTNEILHGFPDTFTELNLEKIEPLTVSSIRFAGDPSSPVNLDLSMSDMEIQGLSNITVTKFEGFTKDPKDIKQLYIDGSSPRILLDGKYKTSGKLLVVPIVGEGDIHVEIKNMQFKFQVKPKVEVRDGKTYLTIESAKCKAKADGMTVDPKNLFQGQKALAESTVQVLNDNWQVLWDEISPQINDEIRMKITRIMNSFSKDMAYEDMFL